MAGRDLVFTAFIKALESETEPSGEAWGKLWDALRRVLVHELQRRHLWSGSPRLLGIYGHASWWQAEALDELVAGCMTFVFVDRLPALRAHARSKSNIEGLVFRSIRNYLFDLQRRHDPLGYRIFVFVQSAVRLALQRRWIHLIDGDPKVRNSSLLGLAPGVDSDATGAPVKELAGWVASCDDVLLPGLLTARGAQKNDLLEHLAQSLRRLPDLGIVAVRFKHLVDAFKTDVRHRWVDPAIDTAVAGVATVGEPNFERWVQPELGFEAREAYQALLECMDLHIERASLGQQSSHPLRTLWLFIRDRVQNDLGALPSHRRMANLLGISRRRLPRLFKDLQGALEACRSEEDR